MSLVNQILAYGILPDALVRQGIRRRLAETLDKVVKPTPVEQQAAVSAHAASLRASPIAIDTDTANEQHYEVPTEFYQYVLGPRLKYSSGWFDSPKDSLADSEENMLRLTCERAGLSDGQRILELGCGWGSLSLWMAEHFPNSRITAVSNSATQKKYIDTQAAKLGFDHLTIRTANMTSYRGEGPEAFDRVVSVEMFEHMKNYDELMRRIASWLKPGGRLFVHMFTHRVAAYHYEIESDDDWMAKYFFTGGQMPSRDLLLQFQDALNVREQWEINGQHYEHTANAWLRNMDRHKAEILPLFVRTYGKANSTRWWHYWRIFFMACAELWGYQKGEEWGVSHYVFEK